MDRLWAAPETLFVYGTLRFPDVLVALLGRVPHNAPGTVQGWRVAAVAGRVYPVLIPGEGSVSGLLIMGLSVEEWHTIDAFEDDFYDLRLITLVDGRRGWAYLTLDKEAGLSEDWSVDDFSARDLVAYSANCRAWRRRYERTKQGKLVADTGEPQ